MAPNSCLSAHVGRISGVKIVQNINSTLLSPPLTGPSRGGMFGCNAIHPQIRVVEAQPQITLNKVRVGVEPFVLGSPRG